MAGAGHDQHSLIADPKFVNAAEHDFRLQPDSPAFQLGFAPIDTSQIGLYGDPDWVRAPQQIKRQVYVPKPPAEPQPTPVLDDFEEALTGLPPDGSDGQCGERREYPRHRPDER